MKKILSTILGTVLMTGTAGASFMYQEIDPICSISGTTHTSFPGEISDTSSWNIPKAYDGECDESISLSLDEKEGIYTIMTNFLNSKNYLTTVSGGYGITTEGRIFIEDTFFPAIQNYINRNRENKKAIAVLNNAVSMIGYDYFISSWVDTSDYVGLTESEALKLAEKNGVGFRVGMKDGEMYGVTMDFVPGRITATIENGIVVDYTIEG